MATIYSIQQTTDYLNKLHSNGFECIDFVEDGGCSLDTQVWSDGETYYTAKGVYLNEWSSGMTIRRSKKFPKWFMKYRDAFEKESN